jgi:ribonuclease BN (tRNA processing enzyme)
VEEKRFEYTMIFTHSHWDHILGFPFFKPIYLNGTHINLFGCPFAQGSIRQILSRTMTVPNFPVKFEEVSAGISYHDSCLERFFVKSVEVVPIVQSHPNQSIGYKFNEHGKSFVYMTDNELSYKHEGGLDYRAYVDFARNADLLIHDSEYTEEEYRTKKTWGHSLYKDALNMALDAGVSKFGLFHHNQERTDAGVNAIVDDCQRIIAERKSALECFAVYEDMEIAL